MDLEVQQMTAEGIGYWGAMERAKSTRLWLKRLGPAISFLFDPKIRLVKTAGVAAHDIRKGEFRTTEASGESCGTDDGCALFFEPAAQIGEGGTVCDNIIDYQHATSRLDLSHEHGLA
jgi:hypothetical protein